MSTSKVGISCGRCGGTQFEFPTNPKPNDTVKCIKCGATGTWGAMQKSALDQTKKQVEESLKKLFKRR